MKHFVQHLIDITCLLKIPKQLIPYIFINWIFNLIQNCSIKCKFMNNYNNTCEKKLLLT